MAYIQPNSTIQLYGDVSLSPSYDDTLYFVNTGEKDNYLSQIYGSKGIATCTAMSYNRETRGFVRVELPMSTCYSATYMRFKNTSFEGKWFYAFVKSVEYINNVTTQINFELDYIMTWMGAFSLGQCFVERQHVRNDSIGANIADEGISCGAYVIEGKQASPNWGSSASTIRIQVANPEEAQANKWGGIYNPTTYTDSDSASAISSVIEELVDKNLTDNVLNVYMCPTEFANPGGTSGGVVNVTKPYSSVDGYVPRNNKLYCYPYKYLEVNNGEGNSKTYKYEFFNTVPDATSTGNCTFNYRGITTNGVQVRIVPDQYNGDSSQDSNNGLTMTHFPSCAWSYDTYKAQLAQENAYYTQNITKNFVHGVTNIGAGATSGAIQGLTHYGPTGAVAGGIGGAVGGSVGLTASTINMVADKLIDNLIQPESGSTTSGTPTSDITFANNEKMFTFYKMSVTKNYAKMIDDYFTMFGYKVKQVMTPNMNARLNWTYVKTIGCIVHGNLPADHAKMIEDIFDKGVRFWKGIDMIGNYDLANTPI